MKYMSITLILAMQWGQLPPSGHYSGIPHIIGDKLTMIGGYLSATKQRTNKVSTFDDGTQLGYLTTLTCSQLEVDLEWLVTRMKIHRW